MSLSKLSNTTLKAGMHADSEEICPKASQIQSESDLPSTIRVKPGPICLLWTPQYAGQGDHVYDMTKALQLMHGMTTSQHLDAIALHTHHIMLLSAGRS